MIRQECYPPKPDGVIVASENEKETGPVAGMVFDATIVSASINLHGSVLRGSNRRRPRSQ